MSSRYFFTAAMDIPENKESAFNEIYEEEHIPYLSDDPGVHSIARFAIVGCLFAALGSMD